MWTHRDHRIEDGGSRGGQSRLGVFGRIDQPYVAATLQSGQACLLHPPARPDVTGEYGIGKGEDDLVAAAVVGGDTVVVQAERRNSQVGRRVVGGSPDPGCREERSAQ